jgi:alpha-L-arabinofuranosidase
VTTPNVSPRQKDVSLEDIAIAGVGQAALEDANRFGPKRSSMLGSVQIPGTAIECRQHPQTPFREGRRTNLGDEILNATTADTEVFFLATRDSHSGRLFVKMVNATASPRPSRFNLPGARNVAGTATALPLAADPQATNSIDVPQNVVPVSAKLAGVKSGLTYTVPANAIVVLTLQTR